MQALGLPVVLEDPNETCIEVWWGWDFSTDLNGNVKVLLSVGETALSEIPDVDQFDLIFITSQTHLNFQLSKVGWTEALYLWRLGVDPEIFPVLPRVPARFTLTHMGSGRRKGTALVCEAFDKAFGTGKHVMLEIRHPEACESSRSLARKWRRENIRFIIQVPFGFIEQLRLAR